MHELTPDDTVPQPAPPSAPSETVQPLAIVPPKAVIPPPALVVARPVGTMTIDEYLEPRPRNWRFPLFLFLATCVTTFYAGTIHWRPGLLSWDYGTLADMRLHWQSGLIYMLAVLGILLAHEMGHFLMTVRYRIPASYPIFIPLPFGFTGTMGAVIGMEGSRANRRQMFDIGLAGPLAGLVVAIPILCVGIMWGEFVVPKAGTSISGDPLLAKLLFTLLRPDYSPEKEIVVNPFYMAGWVGMLITGLNMMPVSQLDGGHVIYCLFGKRAHYIARAFLLGAMAWMITTENYQWTLMVVLVTVIGTDHPPTSNDKIPLGWGRTILGLVSAIAIPILCFISNPLE
ncbi:MAG: site-2 protease family protein [Planctomycetota bacterium]|nr:site-2 protease family protein [Planctomycetota bacterium]